MDDVRSGKVEAIVVRDLSRFGRDYIEVGNYLEKIFPALGTRFISVKENFDNFTCGSSMESLSVSLQNLINALYSRDISRKVSTALLAQQQNGTFQSRNPPYGYMWNEDKSAYVIDEAAAPYVRNIFRWKMEGVSVNSMIHRLEEAGAVHPELRKRENGSRHGNQVGKGWAKYNAAVSSISLKLNALSQKRSKLYESYVEGILNEEEYSFAKKTYEKEHERLSQLMDEAVQRRTKFLDSISPDNKWMSMMKAATGTTELTQKLVNTMIEKVLIYENGAVEVVLYYDDVYQEMCQSVLEMQKKKEAIS